MSIEVTMSARAGQVLRGIDRADAAGILDSMGTLSNASIVQTLRVEGQEAGYRVLLVLYRHGGTVVLQDTRASPRSRNGPRRADPVLLHSVSHKAHGPTRSVFADSSERTPTHGRQDPIPSSDAGTPP